ncbi:MAG: saccharopine dehydrogenase family protein [Candidatus Brockarchaeota archaeon]|nr:saccharopine dehydrogenase family protein [Candidatus Brockarchaeota archaeon]
MKILTVGCGYVGSVLSRRLSERFPSAEIIVSDADKKAIEKASSSIGRNDVRFLQIDFSDHERLVEVARGCDVMVGLTPGRLGYEMMKVAIGARVDMVDLSYMAEDPLSLGQEASEAGIRIVPDCGVAPGLSNVIVGRAASMLDEVKDVAILVGGLPQEAVPPLGYKVTWCVEDLIEEYVRKAKIVKGGKTVEVEALDGLEEVEFPGVGKLEAFYTDGVRTLHSTVKAENMWEKTMRYPGHAEKVKTLRMLGFFDEQPIEGVSPRFLTGKLLERKLGYPDVKDLVAMKVYVSGLKGGKNKSYTYYLLDRYDEEEGVSAMGRTTAYTASAAIELLAGGLVEEKGVIPPEKLGMDGRIYREIMARLGMEGIVVEEA